MEFKTHVTLHKDGTYSLGVNLDYGFMSPDDMIKLAENYNIVFIVTDMSTYEAAGKLYAAGLAA